MDNLIELAKKINGWKTIIGAIGTPIASAILYFTPQHTLAHQISLGFTIVFGSVGVSGVVHKKLKGELPKGLRRE